MTYLRDPRLLLPKVQRQKLPDKGGDKSKSAKAVTKPSSATNGILLGKESPSLPLERGTSESSSQPAKDEIVTQIMQPEHMWRNAPFFCADIRDKGELI